MASAGEALPVPEGAADQGDQSSPRSDAGDAADPIYYLYPEDVCWWEEEQPAPRRAVAEDTWEHLPPPPDCLLETVHRLNDTHIRSPFLYARRPHEYKSEAYALYRRPVPPKERENEPRCTITPIADSGDAEAAARPPEATEEPIRRRVNIELSPVKSQAVASEPRKTLRERLRDGEVVFYEDFVEREIARDYCRLFGQPFSVPRHDWGGGDFFFGEYVPPLANARKDAAVPDDEDAPSEATVEPVEVPVKHREVDSLILADATLDPKQRQELLDGEIGSLYSCIPSSAVRQRHPKDRLVSFHHLRTYACMIDSVTKCPLIHLELQSALQQGWSPEQETVKLQATPKTGQGPPDPYAVTPEQVAQAKEILASRLKPKVASSSKVNLTMSRRQAANKEVVQVGGGRYEV
ncbi:chromosome segregation protein [Babesia caballi]|uniref:Chromosome segregation protein n=1 Tax=Babesia caballi TaxID=5871 RepID=A0AAV4LPZ6_BABCB|nr:chromosome segregation protein [Babesia caballi]